MMKTQTQLEEFQSNIETNFNRKGASLSAKATVFGMDAQQSRNRRWTCEAEAARTLIALREKASQVQLVSSLSEMRCGQAANELEPCSPREFATRAKAERVVAALTIKASQMELISLLSQELEDIDPSIPEEKQLVSTELQHIKQVKELKPTKRPSLVSPMKKTIENRKVCLRRHPTLVKINQHHVRVESPLSLEDIVEHIQQALCTNK